MRVHFLPDGAEGGGGDDGGQAGGGQGSAVIDEGAGGEGDPGGDQGPTWEQAAGEELPAHLAARFEGCRTYGDLDARYRNSSGEARRQADRAAQYEQLSTSYQQQMAEVLLERARGGNRDGTGGRATSGTRDPRIPPGFESIEEFNALQKAGQTGEILRRSNRAALEDAMKDPEFRKQFVGPELKPVQEQLQRQAQAEWGRSTASAFERIVQQNPDFGEGKPLYQALQRTFETTPELLQLGQRNPQLAYELAAARVLQGVQGQQMRAAQAKQAEAAKRGGTARPGAGNAGAAKGGGFEERIRAVAAQNGNSEEEIQEALRAGKRMSLMK